MARAPKLPDPKPSLFSTALYQPGRPIEDVLAEFGLTRALKLASNENLFGISPRARKAFEAAAGQVNYYPDTACLRLARALSTRLEVPEGRIVFGNGTVELIYDLIRAYVVPGAEVVVGTPSFSAYGIATRIEGGSVVEVPVRGDSALDLVAMRAAISPRTRLVFLPNPNNPTGTIYDRDELARFLAELPGGILVVLDEAYHDYMDDPSYPDSQALLRAGEPVGILRSLSKSLGIAGLRIGYGLFPEPVARALRQVQVPFHCSLPAQAAALAGLEDREFLATTRARLRTCRAMLAKGLKAAGYEVVPSHANFMMFRVGDDARPLARALMARGVIVRPGEDLGAPGWIRVTVGPEETVHEFLEALAAVKNGSEAKSGGATPG